MISKLIVITISLTLSACTSPDPTLYNASEGWNDNIPEYWPDDGWKPPPMYEPDGMLEIMERGVHICEIVPDSPPCQGIPAIELPSTP